MSVSGIALTLSECASNPVKRPFSPMRTTRRPKKTKTGQFSPSWRRLARGAGIRTSLRKRSADHGGAHDAIHGYVVPRKLLVDATLQHDKDSVDHADQLARIGGVPDDSYAIPGDICDQRVDEALGADVDAAGDIVEKEDRRLGQEPLLQERLLLVAAAEIGDRLGAAAGVDLGPCDRAADQLALVSRIEKSEERPQLPENGVGDVVGHGFGEQEPFVLALLGHVG